MLECRAQVKEGGRIVIPAAIRKKMHLEVGEDVILKLENDELHVISLRNAVFRAQALVQKYNPTHKKLSEEFLALRKEENDE